MKRRTRLHAARTNAALLLACSMLAGTGCGEESPSVTYAAISKGELASQIVWQKGTTDGWSVWDIGQGLQADRADKSVRPQVAGGVPFARPNATWTQQDAADFDGDGDDDLLWRNEDGRVTVWLLDSNGRAQDASVALTVPLGPGWKAEAASDFDLDGRADVLLRNPGSGDFAIAYTNSDRLIEPTVVNLTGLPDVGPAWEMVGAVQLDGRGVEDLVWYNPTAGRVALWALGLAGDDDRATFTRLAGNQLDPVPTAWRPEAVGDVDGDCRGDILWRNASIGQTSVWRMGSGEFGLERLSNHPVKAGNGGNVGAAWTPTSILQVGCARETTACPPGESWNESVRGCVGGPDGPVCTGVCEQPDVAELDFSVEWHWEGDPATFPSFNQLRGPLTVGDVDADGTPDVVFAAFEDTGVGSWRGPAVLRVVSGDDGSPIWTFPSLTVSIRAAALGNLDADPGLEMVTCRYGNERPMVIDHDGSLVRIFPPNTACVTDPALGDVDGDGIVEFPIAIGGDTIGLAHADGTIAYQFPGEKGHFQFPFFNDVDGDGDLEIVGNQGVYEADGTPLWEDLSWPGWHQAIADLDGDGAPEMVSVSSNARNVRILDAQTGALLHGPVVVDQNGLPPGHTGLSGGPPVIANMDDDPEREIGLASATNYVVFEHDLTVKWFDPTTTDLSSGITGSSVFDFNGDRVAEVVYADENTLRIYDGPTGTPVLERCNTSSTGSEYPVIADVDGDGSAEVIVISGDFHIDPSDDNPGFTGCAAPGAATNGVRVFGNVDDLFMPTRGIWNQYAYHITNVNDDGSIPTDQQRNWTDPRYNNFRQNVGPVVEVPACCDDNRTIEGGRSRQDLPVYANGEPFGHSLYTVDVFDDTNWVCLSFDARVNGPSDQVLEEARVFAQNRQDRSLEVELGITADCNGATDALCTESYEMCAELTCGEWEILVEHAHVGESELTESVRLDIDSLSITDAPICE